MEEDLLKDRDLSNIQRGKCTFAQIYLKIPVMKGEIFCAFLILGSMSKMVPRRIFDKRANYGGRFVKNRDIANFQRGKCSFAPMYLKFSAIEGEIFWAFIIRGTMSTMVSRRIFDKCANYVERFVMRSGYCAFSRWKMYLCNNLSQNLCDAGWNILGIFNFWSNVYNGGGGGFLINVPIM